MTSAIHDAGYIITEHDPDYVVLGETLTYNPESLTKVIRLIMSGARFVANNPDSSEPSEAGIIPTGGAAAALIEKVAGLIKPRHFPPLSNKKGQAFQPALFMTLAQVSKWIICAIQTLTVYTFVSMNLFVESSSQRLRKL